MSRPAPTRDPARWRRVQDLFDAALERAPAERAGWLAAACGGDAGLRDEVTALVAGHDAATPLLDDGLAAVAARIGAESAALPAEVGPYRILRLLGEGGMGTVLLGEHVELGQLAAVKLLRDAALSPARRARFTAEQRTLALLDHPCIARVHDADVLPDGTPWFAMEYVDGVPLTAWCAARGAPAGERLRLFLDVCHAVEHAHARAVIHRDLKPANILVSSEGAVKLVDFGIAKQVRAVEEPDPGRALPLLTPAYAAPELLRAEPAHAQADVWALGVILYQLLAARLPFDPAALSPGEAQLRIARGEVERPSTTARAARPAAGALAPARLSRGAWADLDAVCLTALQPDPARRYRSVEALARDVEHHRRSEPLEARTEGARYRVAKFVGRHRRGLLAAALVTAVVTAMAAFYTARLARARAEALAEAARTRRIQRFVVSLFEGGDPAAGRSEDLRVVTLVERGARQVASLDADPEAQVDLLQTLGGISTQLGDLERADALLGAALQRRGGRSASPAQDVDGLVALARLRSVQARHEEAEELTRQAVADARGRLPPRHPALARAVSALGQVLEDRGRYADAAPLLEEAAGLQSVQGDLPELLETLVELANVRFHDGDYDAAEALNRRVLELQRGVQGPRHPRYADTLINLATLADVRGRYAEAERLDREALGILEAHYGADHPETASALTQVGRELVPQGRYGEAEEVLRRALAVQERAYGPVHPRVASALDDLARAERKQRRLQEAEAHQRRAAEIYRATNGEHHFTYGIALANLGAIALDRGDWRAAAAQARRALEVYAASLPPDHDRIAIARIVLGRALLGAGDVAAALDSTRAGHDALASKPSVAPRWLAKARADLAREYAALGRSGDADRMRAESEAAGAGR